MSGELAGKVAVKFTITSDGAVKSAVDGGSTLPDKAVQACIAKAFTNLSFPQPEGGGSVDVVYPITFNASGGGARMSGGPSPYVLTRLHLRYGKDALGEDLVFRAAPPIEGGRGVPGQNGELPRGVQQAGSNNFQGRYVIRHPWAGPITCNEPRRGIWGGPVGPVAPAVTACPARGGQGGNAGQEAEGMRKA